MRAPVYQPGQVAPAEVAPQRYVAASDGGGIGGAIGQGLQEVGGAVSNYATTLDHIHYQFDDAHARDQGLQFKSAVTPITTGFQTLQGANAVQQAQAVQDQLQDLRQDTLDNATNPRMRKLLEQYISPSYTDNLATVQSHTIRQLSVMQQSTLQSEQASEADAAASAFADPAKMAEHKANANDALTRLAEVSGWSPETTALERHKLGSGIYTSAIHQNLASGHVDMAKAIADAHSDDLTAGDRNDVLSALKKPLEDRAADSDAAALISGVSSAPAAGKGAPVPADGGKYVSPVNGGTVTNTYAQHVARGSHGLDIGGIAVGSAIHPIASGEVTAVVPDSGKSGNYVAVKHPDGTTSTYSHMGNFSVKVGDQVAAGDVLGTVGMTGHTTGPHVHLRVKDPQGHDIDPQKIIGSNAAASSVVGSPTAPRQIDLAAANAHADAMVASGQWDFERAQRAKAAVAQRNSVFEGQLNQRRKDAGDAADEVLTGMITSGKDFTSVSQLPRDVWNALSPPDRLKYARVADANKPGVAAVKADGPLAVQLKIMQFDPNFRNADLSGFYGKVTNPELAGAILAKAKAVRDYQTGNQEWTPRTGITSAVSYGETMGGISLKPQEKATVMQTMEAQARALHRQTGKEPTDNDYQSFFRSATRKVAVPGMIWGTNQVPAYDATKVPADADRRIRARWKASGHTPSDDDVLKSYRAGG